MIAVQDDTGTVYRERGLDLRDSAGTLVGFAGSEGIDNEALWELPCDFLVPAALEGQITPARAARINARLLVEGANGPTLPAAEDVLAERNITVVPDAARARRGLYP